MPEHYPGCNKSASRGAEGVYAIKVTDNGGGGLDFRGKGFRQNRQSYAHAKCRNQQTREKNHWQEHGRVSQRAPSQIQKVVIEPFTAEGEKSDDCLGEAKGQQAIPR